MTCGQRWYARAFLLASLVIAPGLHAQQLATKLSLQEATDLSAAFGRGDLSPAITAMSNRCGTGLREVRERNGTVSERARKAREARQCARQLAAVLVALAPSEKAYQVREFLATLVEEYETEERRTSSEEEFLGLRWGVGLGVSTGKDKNINDASIVGGIVRVTEDIQDQPRVLLEYHKFFIFSQKNANRGLGPFVAAAATGENLLSGVAMGLMAGFKANDTDVEGFSVGLGAVLDGKVKDLGDGFAADSPPPSGETAVRFRTRSRWSMLIFVTRTF